MTAGRVGTESALSQTALSRAGLGVGQRDAPAHLLDAFRRMKLVSLDEIVPQTCRKAAADLGFPGS
jgi:hypothetical protein